MQKHPQLESGGITEDRGWLSTISCKTSFKRAPRESRPTPEEWVSREGPAPLRGWGNWGTRGEAGQGSRSPSSLGSPSPHDGVDSLRLPTHTHPPPGAGSLLGDQEQDLKTGLRNLPPWFAARERWERACLQSNMAAPRPPPHPSLPQAGGFPSRRSGGREDGPTPPGPFSPLPLLAEEITYPTWLTAAARSPHSPRRTRKKESQAPQRPELFWPRRGGLRPTAGPQ
jgi:hypothetical protein